MIPTTREIVYALYGAWRLAHVDRGGMGYFDTSAEGFWKSFFAAALVAPAYLILVLLDPATTSSQAGLLRIVLVHTLSYSLSWTAYPVIVHPLCAALGRESAYSGFIVAFNWIKVIQMAAYLPVVVIVAGKVLPEGVGELLNTLVYLLLLVYQWLATRVALDIKPLPSTGLVALDFFLGVIISVLALGMIK